MLFANFVALLPRKGNCSDLLLRQMGFMQQSRRNAKVFAALPDGFQVVKKCVRIPIINDAG